MLRIVCSEYRQAVGPSTQSLTKRLLSVVPLRSTADGPSGHSAIAELPHARATDQYQSSHPLENARAPGRQLDLPGNGATAARPCLPSVRSPSARPAGTAVFEAKIKTLQAEIVKLEAVVAGQQADLERERHRANPFDGIAVSSYLTGCKVE
jgi:hypothetical protein